MKSDKIMKRVENLETRFNVGSVSVLKVTMWRPECDGVGTVYMKNTDGAGKRFKNDEEAEAWIREDKKNHPVEPLPKQ